MKLTGIVFDLERSSDFIVGVGIQTEIKRRSVSFRTIVIIGGQDLDNFSWWHMFRKNWPVILQLDNKKKINSSPMN